LVFAGASQLTPTGFAYDQSEFDEVSTKSVLLTTKDLHVMYNETTRIFGNMYLPKEDYV
jgi:hypothetical protein